MILPTSGNFGALELFWKMGAQLSVVVHNKCGCAHTFYWFLELLICIPRWDFKVFVSLHVLCIKKSERENKEKRKEKKRKEKERKERKEIKGVWI